MMTNYNLIYLLLWLLARCNRNDILNPPGKGKGWTIDVIKWNNIKANIPVMITFDGFRAADSVGISYDYTALVIKRSGCYELEYLVNVNDFVLVGGRPTRYNGIEAFMAVNGNPISKPFRVDPTGILFNKVTTVATDKITFIKLKENDEISIMLRSSANGSSMTVTPSAWLEARYICNRRK